MKTFAEMLPTATAEMREFVEAYVAHECQRLCDKYGYQMQGGLNLMRATPPAKEPVSVDGVIVWEDAMTLCRHVRLPNHEPGNLPVIKVGDRVRVVKIEETT